MTTGPDSPYGEPQPPYQPPAPPPPYGSQPSQPSQPPSYQPPGYPPYGGPGGLPPGYLPPGYVAPVQNEGLAVAAMVVGIVSLVLACGYGIGLLGSPVALVLGRVSMKRIDRAGGQLGAQGMAKAGFIL